MKKKFYETNLFVVLLLILFFPLGLYLMFKRKCFNKPVRIAIASVFAIIAVASALNQPVNKNNNENDKASETSADNNINKKVEEEVKPLTVEEIVSNVGKDLILEVNSNDHLVVKMKFPSAFSNSSSITSAFLKAKDIIKDSLVNGHTFESYQFWFTADLIDVYGNTENSKVLSFEYDKATVEKINFDRVTNDNFEYLAANVYKHPAITK